MIALAIALCSLVPATPPQVGPIAGGGHLVTTLQTVRPLGDSIELEGRPVDLALAPGGATLYAKHNGALVTVDTAAWQRRASLAFDKDYGASMHGIAVSADGARIYVTTAQELLFEAAVDGGGAPYWSRRIPLPGPGPKKHSHACGIALASDGATAWVCLSRNNGLGRVDLGAGALVQEIPVGVAPYDVVLGPDGRTAYVSNWGGRHPGKGEPSLKSSGTSVLVDARGVAASGTVSIVDLEAGRETAQIDTGLHPSDLLIDGGRLYAANANSDTVTVIDLAQRAAAATWSVRPEAGLPPGSAPTALAMHGGHLAVALGGNNAVALLDPACGALRGLLPTAWYPGALASGGAHLYIANVKGLGSRTRDPLKPGYNSHGHRGTLGKAAVPEGAALAQATAAALEGARIAAARSAPRPARATRPVPVPRRAGEPSVFEHVVYIIKENRTYDQVLGDLPQGNGDPSLCSFGRAFTPNHHALAEQFVLLDNFYCNGVLSADGHSWATEGNVADHLEKSFGGFTRSYTWGDDPLTYSAGGFLWDRVLDAGKTVANFGELGDTNPILPKTTFLDLHADFTSGRRAIKFLHSVGIPRLAANTIMDYPGWNMNIPDVLRASVFVRELQRFEREGRFPSLVLVYLPQDHTSGTEAGMPTPRAHMADNDLAFGQVVQALSHSSFWPKTCIFAIEDDPQDGYDHVDGHRSIAFAVSPYTRRGAVVSHFYNQTSVLRTIGRILGVEPMTQFDAAAPLMDECFQRAPDFRPYAALPANFALDELNPDPAKLAGDARRFAEQSAALDFERPDRADEDTLNRILWHAQHGDRAYPAGFAGAHGRGLAALGLALAPAAPAEDGDDDAS